MAIHMQCQCGERLQTREDHAGRRAQCPACGRPLTIPQKSLEPAVAAVSIPAGGGIAGGPDYVPATAIHEFLDPPAAPPGGKDKAHPLRLMFEALLDPRSIQWMLTLGGGLAVLGLIVWLTSLGVFENKMVLAVALGIGTLAILGSGWWVVLKTRFRVAGQALTFLGCVVAPLNLWFYDVQGLVTLENNLWIGAVVCSLLYVLTVYVLRDPLFLYAVEGGVTLAAALFLADLGLATDTVYLSLTLMVLGLASIHAERAFPPEAETFDRRRFGLPLFWSGHAQIGSSLAVLLVSQIFAWLSAHQFLQAPWAHTSTVIATGLWLVATYAYLYSDLVVQRVGIYTYLAAFSFILAEVTLIGLSLPEEWLIAILALTAVTANIVQWYFARPDERISRAVPPLAMALSLLPILLGIVLHVRATSTMIPESWRWDAGWFFVVVMVLVAVCNRISALLCRHTTPKWSAAYFFASAAAAVVAAAGLLRMFGQREWTEQAPWLMLLPLGYLVASRLWRGHSPERPLNWVAQASTAVILWSGLVASLESDSLGAVLPRHGETANLLLGLVFAEATVFYLLASAFRRRSANLYFAAAAGCGTLWQFLGYWNVPGAYQTMLYAVLGVGFLGVARGLGLEQTSVYGPTGRKTPATRGRGLAAFQAGNAIVSVSLLAAFFQGLMRLVTQTSWPLVIALSLTVLAAMAAAALVPSAAWRRLYAAAAIALAALAFLAMNVLIHLTLWQKAEIFLVALGTVLVVAGYLGRFREAAEGRNEMVTLGLWIGSSLVTLPLLIAVAYYRVPGHAISLIDEIALLILTVAMLVTGFSWQIKSTTFCGGTTLFVYLVMIIVSLGWRQQMGVGAVIGVVGVVLFAFAIVLSIYRDKLMELPDRIARREGLFRMLSWR